MASTQTAPEWLYLPLPANADADAALLKKIEQACSKLPENLTQLQKGLDGIRSLASYEPAANRANELVWASFEELVSNPAGKVRTAFVKYAVAHLPPRATARILRRLAKDPDMEVRNQVA